MVVDKGVITADEGVKGVFGLGESARVVGSLLPMLPERRRLRDSCLFKGELFDDWEFAGITSGGRSFGDGGGRGTTDAVDSVCSKLVL